MSSHGSNPATSPSARPLRRRVLRTGLVVVAVYVVGAAVVNELTPHAAGTPSSSYSTASDGLNGYAQLLQRSGHPIARLRSRPAAARLDPGQTVVLLNPDVLTRADVNALRTFVVAGGRLIAGGREPDPWLAELLTDPPSWNSNGDEIATILAPVPETGAVQSVQTNGDGSWSRAGATLPALGNGPSSLLTVGGLGAGRVALLADPSALENDRLASADNAALGVGLAGPSGRPVAFEEGIHGYGSAHGLAGLPAAGSGP